MLYQAAIMSPMATLPLTPDELLTTTRSVRKRLDLTRPVPLDLVRECLEVALQAPSGSNRQGWHWMLITDQSVRRVIGDYYREAVASYLNSSGAAASLFADDRNAARCNAEWVTRCYLGEHMGEVPVLIIPCISAPRLSQEPGRAVGIAAAGRMELHAGSKGSGLGTAWTTLHLRYEKEISGLLRIPADIRQGVLIPTAYYIGDTFKPAPRQPLDAVLHINAW